MALLKLKSMRLSEESQKEKKTAQLRVPSPTFKIIFLFDSSITKKQRLIVKIIKKKSALHFNS